MSYNNYNRGYAEPTMTSADYMTRTYRWMALGLLVTFAAAFVTATTPLFYVVNSLYLLFTLAEDWDEELLTPVVQHAEELCRE